MSLKEIVRKAAEVLTGKGKAAHQKMQDDMMMIADTKREEQQAVTETVKAAEAINCTEEEEKAQEEPQEQPQQDAVNDVLQGIAPEQREKMRSDIEKAAERAGKTAEEIAENIQKASDAILNAVSMAAEQIRPTLERFSKAWDEAVTQQAVRDGIIDKWQLEKMKMPNNERRRRKMPMIRRRAYLKNRRNKHRMK